MAEPTKVEMLKDHVVRYLRIRRNLGERELVLSRETVRALEFLKSYKGDRGSEMRSGGGRRALEQRAESGGEVGAFSPSGEDVENAGGAKARRGGSEVRDLTGMSKAEALEVIRGEILTDPRLPELFPGARNMVFGVGDRDAGVMFVGEAPGEEEDRKGEPFVGRAGELLDKMIVAMGLRREAVYISNVVKYRPEMPEGSRGNRKPTSEELKACRPYLLRQIRVIQPAVIVALGATAVEGLLDESRVSITRMRGQWKNFEGIPLMPTFHPSYLLHNQSPSEKRKVWEDLLEVMEKVGLPVSEKQRRYFKGRG